MIKLKIKPAEQCWLFLIIWYCVGRKIYNSVYSNKGYIYVLFSPYIQINGDSLIPMFPMILYGRFFYNRVNVTA